MKRPTAILFDMDGLMLDSESTRAESFKRIIRRHSGDVKEDIPQLIGVRVLDNWKIMKERYGLTEDPEKLMEEGEEEYTNLSEESMPVTMPGLYELIGHIKETN